MIPTECCRFDLLGGSPLAFPLHLHAPGPFFYSLAGLFVVSLVSNATPFFGASYTLIATTELISFGFSTEAFVLVVVITATGAAIGKLIIYGGAKGFQKPLSHNKNVQLLGKWLQDTRFLLAVFIAAVIPVLPLDDYIYIGAGAAKSRLAPMFAVTIGAKLVKSALEIGLEFLGIYRITSITTRYLGLSRIEFSILLTIVFIVLGIFLFKYDWSRFLGDPLSRLKSGETPPASQFAREDGGNRLSWAPTAASFPFAGLVTAGLRRPKLG